MKEINREEIARMISGLKYCHNWHRCNSDYCNKKKLNIFDPNEERIDYVIKTMYEHNLSEKDLERFLVAYKTHFVHKKEDEETLIGKIRKIYLLFELENTELPFLGSNVCSIM